MATLKMVGEYIREQRQQARISLRQLAQTAGISNPYLSQIERGLRKPSAEILQQIAKGLRISAEALYVQAGFLEDRPNDTEVPTAILTDAAITERQKQVLLDIYESFRKENAAVAAQDSASVSRPAEQGDGHGVGRRNGRSNGRTGEHAGDRARGRRADADRQGATGATAASAGAAPGSGTAAETIRGGTST